MMMMLMMIKATHLLPVEITGAGIESPHSFASKGDLYQ